MKRGFALVAAAPALRCAFAGRQRAAGFMPRQGLRQLGIEAPGDGADAVGARLFRLVAAEEELRFEKILHPGGGFDFGDLLDLLLGGFERMTDVRRGVGLVALLLLDARNILRIETLQGGQPEAVQQNTGQHEAAGPEDIFEHEAFLP
jgi:hypothetical protein